MARQTPTGPQITQVSDDFDTFQLPFDASLDLTGAGRTVYGVTDTAIDLSMVNVAHLNNTRHFRGMWEADPQDLGAPAAYRTGQVVIGSDSHLYIRNNTGGGNPNPVQVGQDVWDILSSGLSEAVTELTTSDPIDLNLFHIQAQPYTFTISPSANATLQNPMVASTEYTGFVGNNFPGISDTGVITGSIPDDQTVAGTIRITTDSRSVEGTAPNEIVHEGGQVDSIITLSDNRIMPEVTPEGPVRTSILDPNQNVQFMMDIHPPGALTTDGTAYAAQWTARAGTATPTAPSAADGTYTVPQITQNTSVTFSFTIPTNAVGGQGNSTPPGDIIRMVDVYNPWYWQLGGDQPTGISTMTEGVLLGETQGNNFPTTGSSQFSITGPIGQPMNVWLAVPNNITSSIVLQTGIARAQSDRIANAFTATNGTASVVYALYRFRLGLIASPTTFNILTT